jgi:transcriptional regulator with XRE-family HTH domain
MTIRKQRKLTGEQVAKQLGISRAHYTHLENGTRPLTNELIAKIAKVLEVSPKIVRAETEVQRLRNLVPNSWIFKIKINGQPFIKAFLEYLNESGRYSSLNNDELSERLIKFIFLHIEHSLSQELMENSEIIGFISRKLGHNQNTPK